MRARSALLEALGGEEGCRRLSAAFYARVGKDPVLRPFFPGKSLKCAINEFAAFLIQFLGGDEKQTQHRWWLSLRESHARFQIGPTARRAWLRHMEATLDAAPLDDATRNALRHFFSHSSAYVIGRDTAESDHEELAARIEPSTLSSSVLRSKRIRPFQRVNSRLKPGYNQSRHCLEGGLLVTAETARLVLTGVCAVLLSTALTACRANGNEGRIPPQASAPILLFKGTGASPEDVAALRRILNTEHLNYSLVDSPQLNAMSDSEIGEYRLLIVPGGNFEQIGNSLTSSTTRNIRTAMQNGLNYLGICAGAFFAGNSPYNGLNLTSGSRFGFYAAEARGVRKAPVAITMAGGETLDQYWEAGPQLTGWGAIVGKYPDGTPATVEGSFGKGWVILTGVHPEAPASWRGGMSFKTRTEIDNAYAATLIRAALNRERLPHF
jgi:hemoglobin